MIFLHWRKGPTWWITYSPKLYFVLLLLVFILIPAACLANTIVILVVSEKFHLVKVFASYFTVTFMVRPIEFYGLVWKTVVYEANFFLDVKSKDLNDREL
jgi:hypothetical protein